MPLPLQDPTPAALVLPPRDLGPLAWVMDELRHALDDAVDVVRQFVADNDASRATDLAEVDATPLRLARQHLHQAAGALDMVELGAAALTVRALEAALARLIQRPALATVETADTVVRGARALLDQLDRVLRERPLPDLALFPTYRDWQQLAGAPRAHPADLWSGAEPLDVAPPAGKAYQPGPAVRAHLDRWVLLVVKQLSPQAAAPLAQLAAGLCRGSEDGATRRFWLAAAAYFEAVAQGLLPDSVPVKRAASSVLLQYTAWSQGDAQGMPALTRDLHALLAQAVPAALDATPCLNALWQAQGWRPELAWNWEHRALGQIDPALLTQARTALATAQRVWAASVDVPPGTQADPQAGRAQSIAAVAPLRALADALHALHPACRGLAGAWDAVVTPPLVLPEATTPTSAPVAAGAPPEPPAARPGLALEASHSLLCLDAELAAFDPLQPALAERMAALATRLHQVLAGQAVPAAEPWMTEVYQRLSEHRTLGHLVAQLQSELGVVEALLDAWFRRVGACPADAPGLSVTTLAGVPAQLTALQGVAQMLGLDAAVLALAAVQRQVGAWLSASAGPTAAEWHTQTAHVGANLAALGTLFEALARQPDWAREGFVFDLQRERLCPVQGPASGDETLPPDAAVPAPPAIGPDGAHPALAVGSESPAPAPTPGGPENHDDEDVELLAIFTDEARDVLAQSRHTLDALRERPASQPDLTTLRRGFHTLKGSARMVGLAGVGETAWAMEQLLNAWLAEPRPASAPLLDLTAAVLEHLQRAINALAAGQPEAGLIDADAVRASADALRLTGDVLPLPEAEPDSPPPLLDEAVKLIGPLCIDLELYNVFLNEADEWSRRLGHALAEWALDPAEAIPAEWPALAHSLAGGSGTVGYSGLSQLARALEHTLERAQALQTDGLQVRAPDVELLARAAEEARTLLHQFAAGFLKEPQAATLDALAEAARAGNPPAVAPVASVAPEPLADKAPVTDAFQPAENPPPVALPTAPTVPAASPASVPIDTLDTDLFAVFEDEALDLLPRLGAALRQWSARPDNAGARAEVLRNLHTFKGSARLAGAMRLGELAHGLESEVLALPEVPHSAAAVRPLLGGLDALVGRLETLRRAFALGAETPAGPSPEGVQLAAPEGLVRSEWAPPPAPPPCAPAASMAALAAFAPQAPLPVAPPSGSGLTVRVRADLLDQLMAQTGDVMISRSRLENDMRALRQSFKDMSGNIVRLRHQLRDLELQTETQMQSRLAQSRDAEDRFDPLEFDRYTRVQELTRLLAESVNDVATVQHHLQRSVEAAEGSLAAQARQTRDLQRDLLRTRMVAFDALAERLHRALRQAADGEGKQAELRLTGAEAEVDRGVLDRLAPVLEHLLRNAVAHGIETPAQRTAAGKPPVGHVTLALQHSGNDLALSLTDDGAGLDLPRLHERALALGLHDSATPFDAAAAQRCMFTPGVSTASEVTELAGRGIGLDVVRTEVLGLGGRIEHFAPEGGGTGFRLLVPLSTAVTQVVMLRVGDFTFGVPAPWVEHVRRAQAPELTAAYVSGQWHAGDSAMPFFWAGALLAQSTESTDPQAHVARNWPVLEFYSAGQRVAWHVDEVLGHQEVVVKPLGPQLARLPGLAGATVLASGAVSLIYNPVALAALYGDAARAWVRTQRAQGVQGAQGAAASVPGDPGQTRRTGEAPLVLVVDDSITVRRVTQRLLKREGYRVALAADGLQALERLREEAPVVVLCDIEMPRMDGFEFVQHLRAEPAWADLPVVMITSRLADKHRDHAQSLGVDHYLGKPYSEDELLALVEGYARLAPDTPPAGWSA